MLFTRNICVYIKTKFTTQAFLEERYKDLLPKIDGSNLDGDIKNKIKWLIERTIDAVNMNSDIYIQIWKKEDRLSPQLLRHFESKGQTQDRWEMFSKELYSLKNIEREIPLFSD